MKMVKRITITFFTILFLLSLGGWLLTQSLSTQMGQERLMAMVNHRIPGKFKVDDLSLSWFSSSFASGIQLFDPSGRVVMTVEQAELSTPLWKMVLPSANPKGALKNLNLVLISDKTGLSSLEQAIDIKASKQNLDEELPPLYLEKVDISYTGNNSVLANGNTRQGDLVGSFELKGSIGKKNEIFLNATNLPTLLIDQISHLKLSTPPGLFKVLIGTTFDTNIQLIGEAFTQKFSSPDLSFNLTGTLRNRSLNFNRPSEIVFTVPPQKLTEIAKVLAINALPQMKNPINFKVKGDDFNLLSDSLTPSGNLHLSLENLAFDTFYIKTATLQASFNPRKSGIEFLLNIEGSEQDAPLILTSKGSFKEGKIWATTSYKGKNIVIDNGEITTSDLSKVSQISGTFAAEKMAIYGHKTKVLPSNWTFRQGSLNTDFKLLSEVGPLNGSLTLFPEKESVQFNVIQSHKGGAFSFYGQIEDAFKADRTIHINSELKLFPSEAIAAFFPQESQLTNLLYSLFGYNVTGTMEAKIEKMKGPFSISMKGERCELQGEGKIEGPNAFLTKPLTASITVSKEVSTYFLDEILPLLNSAVRGDKPITLTIDNEGFYLPLNNPSLANINIQSATLDLGKLYFTSDGKLAEVLSLLKLPAEEIFSVWFTPLYFNLDKGRLNLSRVDMLVGDATPIATWGYIDFPSDKVRMEVGLTGRALTKAFGPLPLPKGYMLAIPLRGPTNNPKLDKTKITAKLASLAAMATGPQGILVGALIQIASGSLTDKVPEPTTSPLPWSIEAQTPEGQNPNGENKQEPSSFPNPMDTLEKGASKILNTFLG